MKSVGRAFTLVELMLVMVLIALLLTLLAPEIPNLAAFHKTMIARTYVTTLSEAVMHYKRIYGNYPYDGAKMHGVSTVRMLNRETDRAGA